MPEITVNQKYARQILALAARYHRRESASKILSRYEAIVVGSALTATEARSVVDEVRREDEISRANSQPGFGCVDAAGSERRHRQREILWQQEEAERRRLQNERKELPRGFSARSV